LPNQGQQPSVNDVLALPNPQSKPLSVNELLTTPQPLQATVNKPLHNVSLIPDLPAPAQITKQAINTVPSLAPLTIPEFDGGTVNTTAINAANPSAKVNTVALPQQREQTSEAITPQTQALSQSIAQATTQEQTNPEHPQTAQALPMTTLLQMKQTLETQLAKDNALFAQQQCQ